MRDPVGATPVLYLKILTERVTARHPDEEHQNSSGTLQSKYGKHH